MLRMTTPNRGSAIWEASLAAAGGDAAESGVVGEEEVAGVEGAGFKVGSGDGEDQPVFDFAGEELDGAERRELVVKGGGVR